MFSNVADAIRTVDLGSRTQLLDQLSHLHCLCLTLKRANLSKSYSLTAQHGVPLLIMVWDDVCFNEAVLIPVRPNWWIVIILVSGKLTRPPLLLVVAVAEIILINLMRYFDSNLRQKNRSIGILRHWDDPMFLKNLDANNFVEIEKLGKNKSTES